MKNLKKDIHFITYRRFKTDPTWFKWYAKLDAEFCEKYKLRYSDGDCRTRNKVQKCFTVFAVSIKTDISKQIRKACEKVHGEFIRERYK